jgi:hypothetical protein
MLQCIPSLEFAGFFWQRALMQSQTIREFM